MDSYLLPITSVNFLIKIAIQVVIGLIGTAILHVYVQDPDLPSWMMGWITSGIAVSFCNTFFPSSK